MARKDRDVLAELASIREYLLGEVYGENPLPGLDADKKRFTAEFDWVVLLVENDLKLADEYASGITHEQRVASSGGASPSADSAEIAELKRQLAEARAVSNG